MSLCIIILLIVNIFLVSTVAWHKYYMHKKFEQITHSLNYHERHVQDIVTNINNLFGNLSQAEQTLRNIMRAEDSIVTRDELRFISERIRIIESILETGVLRTDRFKIVEKKDGKQS